MTAQELIAIFNSPIVWAIVIGGFATKAIELLLLRGKGYVTEKEFYHDLHTNMTEMLDKVLDVRKSEGKK